VGKLPTLETRSGDHFLFTLTDCPNFKIKSPEMATWEPVQPAAGFQRVRCYSSWICASAAFSGHFVQKFAGKRSRVWDRRDLLSKNGALRSSRVRKLPTPGEPLDSFLLCGADAPKPVFKYEK
jgi:hypothetical protein